MVTICLALGAGMLSAVAGTGAAAAADAASGQLVPLTPARIMDSRTGLGTTLAPFAANVSRPLTVTGVGGVPISGVLAVMLSVVAVNSTGAGYVNVWPVDGTLGNNTVLNMQTAAAVSNVIIVPVGTDGQVNLRASVQADLIADVQGYVTADAGSGSGSLYTPVTGTRLMDTRTGLGGRSTPLAAATSLDLVIAGVSPIAANATAVMVNIVGVGPTATSFLQAWPTGQTRPPTGAGSENLVAGRTQAHGEIVGIGTGGKISIYNSAGSTNVLVEVLGYFTTASGGTGSYYTPMTGTRIMDTRTSLGGSPTLTPNSTVSLTVAGVAGVPATGVTSVAIAATGLGATTGTYVTVFKSGTARPGVTTLNLSTGTISNSFAIVPLSSDGKVQIYNNLGNVDVILDVLGYFTSVSPPSPPTAVTATPVDSGLAVSWTAPAGGTGLGISAYTVTASPGGASVTTNGSTAARLTGLSNGTGYTVTVSSRNAAGTSAGSTATSTVTPRTVAGAPTAVTATAGTAQATVTWAAPANTGGSAITGYVVTAAPGGASETTTGATTATVTDLTAGTAYTFSVRALTAAGAGPPSAASAAVTVLAGATGGISTGTVSTLAGSGIAATTAGTGTAAAFNAPQSGATLGGYLYVGAAGGIEKVNTSTGVTTVLTGTGVYYSLASDGTSLFAVNNTCTLYKLNVTTGAATTVATVDGTTANTGRIAAGPGGYIYMGCGSNIARIDPATGSWTTWKAFTTAKVLAVAATSTQVFASTEDIASPYIGRLISLTGSTPTAVELATGLSGGYGIECFGGYVYLSANSILPMWVRRYDPTTGDMILVAGSGPGYADGVGRDARFRNVADIAADATRLYVMDSANNRIRSIDPGPSLPFAIPASVNSGLPVSNGVVSLLAGSGVPVTSAGSATTAGFREPGGITVSGGNAYVGSSDAISTVDLSTGATTILAGIPGTSGSIDGNTGSATTFLGVRQMVNDGHFLYYLDGQYSIRQTSMATGATSTLYSYGSGLSINGLALSDDGVLWFSLYQSIYRMPLNTLDPTLWYTFSSTEPPAALAADHDHLYAETYTGNGTQAHIRSFLLAGTPAPVTLVDFPPNGIGAAGTTLVSAGGFIYTLVTNGLREYAAYGTSKIDGSTYYAFSGAVDNVAGLATDGILLYATDGRSRLGSSVHKVWKVQTGPPGVQDAAGVTGAARTAGGGSLDSSNNQCSCSDPVNTATGEFYETDTDVSLPGRVAVNWTRTYSSVNSATNGPLGYGWATPYTAHVVVGATGTDPVTVVQENGSITTFTPNGTGGFVADPRTHATLARDAGTGVWTYVRRRDATFVFFTDGRWKSVTDRNGETITAGYDTSAPPRLTSVATPDGRALTIAYNAGGRIASVTGPSATGVPARQILYGYDTAGNLTTVTDSRLKVTTFGYDTNHRLLTSTTPLGAQTTNVYDAQGRVTSQKDARLKTTTFAYTDDTSGGVFQRTTRVTDPTGVITDIVYANGWIARKVTAPGTAGQSTISYVYDAIGDPLYTMDPTGVVTAATFDADGNMLTQTVPAGPADSKGRVAGTMTTTWSYNAFNEPLVTTDTAGHTVTSVYDSRGNLTSHAVQQRSGQTATTRYSHATATHPGDLTQLTDPRGQVTRYGYTAQGFVASLTAPAGNTGPGITDTVAKTTWTYTPYGEPMTVVEPRGNASGATASAYTTTFGHDNGGLLTTTTDPLTHVTTYGYDDDGHRITVKNNTNQTWITAYLPGGLLSSVTDPLTHLTSQKAYDDAGRIASATDATGGITTTTYDDHGRPRTIVSALGNAAGATAAVTAGATTTLTYDAANRLLTSGAPNPAGGAALTSTAVYDSAGRAWKNTNPAGESTRTDYDALNRVAVVTDPVGNTTEYAYDWASRPTSVTDGRGKTTSTDYDTAGHVISVTDPLGHLTTRTWDGAGRPWQTVDPRGNAAGATASNYTSTSTYDLAGEKVTATNNLGNTWTYGFDPAGRTVSVTTPNNRTTSYGYDTINRLTTITAPDTGLTTYGYDNANRRTSVTDPRLHQWSTGYDNAGRVTSETDPLTHAQSYAYTPDGQLGTVTTSAGTSVRSYDPLGRVTGVNYSDATPDLTYTYDAASRRASMQDGAGTLTYGYDGDGRLTAITRGATSWGYTYDASGDVLTRTRPDTTTETWAYDDAGRATNVISPAGTTGFSYNEADFLTATTQPNGTVEHRTWDRAGYPTYLDTTKGAATLQSQTLTRDAVNQPTKTVVTRGGVTENRSYLYDANERLTDVCYAATCTPATATQHWTFDKNGNRLTQQDGITPGVVTTWTYDNADRTASQKIGTGAVTTPTYDNDGQELTDGAGHTWTYDLAGRTTTSTTSGASTAYTFDGDSNRLTSTTTGTNATTTYTWDTNNPLPLLAGTVTDPDGAGATPATTTTVRTDPRGGTLSQTVAATTSWYTHDTLGSVTDLIDATGAITRSYDYTPTGTARTAPGAPTPTGPTAALSYTSALPDTDGTYYLRARQYNPATSTFTQTDPAGKAGSAGENGGYGSSYGYVTGRPTLLTDPSGKWPGWVDDIVETVDYAVHNPGDLLSDTIASTATTLVNIGRGATAGLTDKIVDWISPGASCTVESTSFSARLAQGAGFVGTLLIGGLGEGAMASRGASTVAEREATLAAERSAAAGEAGALARPTVENTKLQNVINDLYRGTTNPNRVGSGTTADAVRAELETGQPTGGTFHLDKARQYSNALNRLLKGDLNDHDRLVAQSLLDDLQNALRNAP